MTAEASSFSLSKFYKKILIFHFTFFRKTSFSKRKWGSAITGFQHKSHQKSQNLEYNPGKSRLWLKKPMTEVCTKNEVQRTKNKNSRSNQLENLVLEPLTGERGSAHSLLSGESGSWTFRESLPSCEVAIPLPSQNSTIKLSYPSKSLKCSR